MRQPGGTASARQHGACECPRTVPEHPGRPVTLAGFWHSRVRPLPPSGRRPSPGTLGCQCRFRCGQLKQTARYICHPAETQGHVGEPRGSLGHRRQAKQGLRPSKDRDSDPTGSSGFHPQPATSTIPNGGRSESIPAAWSTGLCQRAVPRRPGPLPSWAHSAGAPLAAGPVL